MRTVGVHSEVGKLRTVMVCKPSLAHQRLTPANCHGLLFDDVIWVHEAQKDHFDFVLKMQERGVEVLELHDLLAETLGEPEGRRFVLDRLITPNSVGLQNASFMRPWLDELEATRLASSKRPLPRSSSAGASPPSASGSRRGTTSPSVRWLPRTWTRSFSADPSDIATTCMGCGSASAAPWSCSPSVARRTDGLVSSPDLCSAWASPLFKSQLPIFESSSVGAPSPQC